MGFCLYQLLAVSSNITWYCSFWKLLNITKKHNITQYYWYYSISEITQYHWYHSILLILLNITDITQYYMLKLLLGITESLLDITQALPSVANITQYFQYYSILHAKIAPGYYWIATGYYSSVTNNTQYYNITQYYQYYKSNIYQYYPILHFQYYSIFHWWYSVSILLNISNITQL